MPFLVWHLPFPGNQFLLGGVVVGLVDLLARRTVFAVGLDNFDLDFVRVVKSKIVSLVLGVGVAAVFSNLFQRRPPALALAGFALPLCREKVGLDVAISNSSPAQAQELGSFLVFEERLVLHVDLQDLAVVLLHNEAHQMLEGKESALPVAHDQMGLLWGVSVSAPGGAEVVNEGGELGGVAVGVAKC